MSAESMGTTTELPGILTHGVVHAGGVATQYLRAGRGEVVVFLAQELDRDDVRKTVQTLARDFLVLATAPTSGDAASVSRWLRMFLECLGVRQAHVFVQAPASVLTGEESDA